MKEGKALLQSWTNIWQQAQYSASQYSEEKHDTKHSALYYG